MNRRDFVKNSGLGLVGSILAFFGIGAVRAEEESPSDDDYNAQAAYDEWEAAYKELCPSKWKRHYKDSDELPFGFQHLCDEESKWNACDESADRAEHVEKVKAAASEVEWRPPGGIQHFRVPDGRVEYIDSDGGRWPLDQNWHVVDAQTIAKRHGFGVGERANHVYLPDQCAHIPPDAHDEILQACSDEVHKSLFGYYPAARVYSDRVGKAIASIRKADKEQS